MSTYRLLLKDGSRRVVVADRALSDHEDLLFEKQHDERWQHVYAIAHTEVERLQRWVNEPVAASTWGTVNLEPKPEPAAASKQ